MAFGQGHDPSSDSLFGGGAGSIPYDPNDPTLQQNQQNNAFALGGYRGRNGPTGNIIPGTGSADQLFGRYANLGAQAYNQPAPQLQLGQANGYMQFGDAARGQQEDALGLMRARAMGQVPSIAQQQGNYAMQGALQNQLAAANSVRGGPGASALAARSAMLG